MLWSKEVRGKLVNKQEFYECCIMCNDVALWDAKPDEEICLRKRINKAL